VKKNAQVKIFSQSRFKFEIDQYNVQVRLGWISPVSWLTIGNCGDLMLGGLAAELFAN
jgi:hypothetical protein